MGVYYNIYNRSWTREGLVLWLIAIELLVLIILVAVK